MKIDLHIHTNLSRCSNINPREALRAAEKAGLDVIALVNHNHKPINFKGSKKVKVLPGVEVSAKEGHLLIINTLKEFKKGAPAQEIIKQAGNNALVIIAHPFDYMRCGVHDKIRNLCNYDAIEVNARCLSDCFNNEAIDYATGAKKPLVAGSDAHFTEEIGNAYTIVNAKSVSEAIKKIKKGETKLFIKKRSIWNKLKYHLKSMIILKK